MCTITTLTATASTTRSRLRSIEVSVFSSRPSLLGKPVRADSLFDRCHPGLRLASPRSQHPAAGAVRYTWKRLRQRVRHGRGLASRRGSLPPCASAWHPDLRGSVGRREERCCRTKLLMGTRPSDRGRGAKMTASYYSPPRGRRPRGCPATTSFVYSDRRRSGEPVASKGRPGDEPSCTFQVTPTNVSTVCAPIPSAASAVRKVESMLLSHHSDELGGEGDRPDASRTR